MTLTLRAAQIDEKTKVRVSQTLKKNLQKQQAWGGATSVKKHISGTASSVAFTPMQVLHEPLLLILLCQNQPSFFSRDLKLSILKLQKKEWTKRMQSISLQHFRLLRLPKPLCHNKQSNYENFF